MASRGAVTRNGHVTTNEYSTVKIVENAKVLRGSTPQQHGLPDYAHTPNSFYIKENHDDSFRELRIYNNYGFPIIEIGYHPEPNISGNRYEKVLHYHYFDSNLNRYLGGRISPTENAEIYNAVKKYLRRYGL